MYIDLFKRKEPEMTLAKRKHILTLTYVWRKVLEEFTVKKVNLCQCLEVQNSQYKRLHKEIKIK